MVTEASICRLRSPNRHRERFRYSERPRLTRADPSLNTRTPNNARTHIAPIWPAAPALAGRLETQTRPLCTELGSPFTGAPGLSTAGPFATRWRKIQGILISFAGVDQRSQAIRSQAIRSQRSDPQRSDPQLIRDLAGGIRLQRRLQPMAWRSGL